MADKCAEVSLPKRYLTACRRLPSTDSVAELGAIDLARFFYPLPIKSRRRLSRSLVSNVDAQMSAQKRR